jgi:hypothetical protein
MTKKQKRGSKARKATKKARPAEGAAAPTPLAALHVLPGRLLDLVLARLPLADGVGAALEQQGVLRLRDLLQQPENSIGETTSAEIRRALERLIEPALAAFEDRAESWPALRAQLLAPLSLTDRRLLGSLAGFDGPPLRRHALANAMGVPLAHLDDRIDALRSQLRQSAAALVERLRADVERELRAFDGVVMAQHAAVGSMLYALTADGAEPERALRLAALLLPHECHLHRGVLFGMAPRRFRALLRRLPTLVPPARLPRTVDALLRDLAQDGITVPRGVLLHVLRTEARVAIELAGNDGEVAMPDPRAPAIRLAELLEQFDQPASLADLRFAWRERYRTASKRELLRHLTAGNTFLRVGEDAWSLRRLHRDELAAAAPLADRVARRIAGGGRCAVAELLHDEGVTDERTRFLVLDLLADDPRVRLLGRGEACPAAHGPSQLVERLLRDFRRAGGDVVESLFLKNQPVHERRLVERLLRDNRCFVRPSPDRVDVLTNYPFNEERLRRMLRLVDEHLARRAGYGHADALCAMLTRSELGGSWLTPDLLCDVLRRHGPFDVLAGHLVAQKSARLPSQLLRIARQALRELDEAVTLREVLAARPELAQFEHCLAELLGQDPLVQTPDGTYFKLA